MKIKKSLIAGWIFMIVIIPVSTLHAGILIDKEYKHADLEKRSICNGEDHCKRKRISYIWPGVGIQANFSTEKELARLIVDLYMTEDVRKQVMSPDHNDIVYIRYPNPKYNGDEERFYTLFDFMGLLSNFTMHVSRVHPSIQEAIEPGDDERVYFQGIDVRNMANGGLYALDGTKVVDENNKKVD